MIYRSALAAAAVAIASRLTLAEPAPAISVGPFGSSCPQTAVTNREFGQAVRHADMLAIDPNGNLGKQVFLTLNNGLRLELNVDSSDMTFMGNFAIGHQVEICSTSGLAFNITDRVTGSYGKARLTSHAFIPR